MNIINFNKYGKTHKIYAILTVSHIGKVSYEMKRLNGFTYIINVLVALTFISCSYLGVLHYKLFGMDILNALITVLGILCGMYLLSLYSGRKQNEDENSI